MIAALIPKEVKPTSVIMKTAKMEQQANLDLAARTSLHRRWVPIAV